MQLVSLLSALLLLASVTPRAYASYQHDDNVNNPVAITVRKKEAGWHCADLERDMEAFAARVALAWAYVRRDHSRPAEPPSVGRSAIVVIEQCPPMTIPARTRSPCDPGFSIALKRPSGRRLDDNDAEEAVLRATTAAPLVRCASGHVVLAVEIQCDAEHRDPLDEAVAAMRSDDPALRLLAAWILSRIGVHSPKGRTALETARNDEDASVRELARRALDARQ